MADPPLAFVDVETTGLSPSEHRVAEIGVVTVDGDRVGRWGTFLRTPEQRRELDSAVGARAPHVRDDAPAFADVASDLACRLSGRLFVAHNARFDHAFLRAEFARVGIAFQPQVLCSVMLSRALYPDLGHHNLDALAACHGLTVEERHRALPDAELLSRWWRIVQDDHPRRTIERAIAKLLAGPTLPPQLDPALIDRLPPKPGAYVLHGAGGVPILVGAAANLRRHVLGYFRMDHATPRALEHAHGVANVTWRVTSGIIGARLEAASLDAAFFARSKRRLDAPLYTWRLLPQSIPCVALASLASVDDDATYGLFATERRARNALVRLAEQHGLCRTLLGLDERRDALPGDRELGPAPANADIPAKRELLRIFDALRTLKVPGWPHEGPIGIRERADLHVVDRWRFLGTARSEHDLGCLREGRPHEFDPRIFRLLQRTLSSIPPRKLVDLSTRTMKIAVTG